jgi:hypothetical protein
MEKHNFTEVGESTHAIFSFPHVDHPAVHVTGGIRAESDQPELYPQALK